MSSRFQPPPIIKAAEGLWLAIEAAVERFPARKHRSTVLGSSSCGSVGWIRDEVRATDRQLLSIAEPVKAHIRKELVDAFDPLEIAFASKTEAHLIAERTTSLVCCLQRMRANKRHRAHAFSARPTIRNAPRLASATPPAAALAFVFDIADPGHALHLASPAHCLTARDHAAQSESAAAHPAAGFGSPKSRRASATRRAGAFFMAARRRGALCQLNGGRREGAERLAGSLTRSSNLASSVASFGSEAPDSMQSRSPSMCKSNAPEVMRALDLVEELTSCLRGVDCLVCPDLDLNDQCRSDVSMLLSFLLRSQQKAQAELRTALFGESKC
jgi:hypothetical protein